MLGADGPSGFDTYMEPGSQVAPATFILFVDDSDDCYVRHGKSGAIVYTSSNHASCINYALDQTQAVEGGGKVYLRAGDYYLTATVTVHSGTWLCGDGPSTHLTVEDGVLNGIAFNTQANNMTVSDLWLEGPGQEATNANGISGSILDNVTVRNCYVSEWSDDGIIIHGPYTRNVMIIDNIVMNEFEGIEVKGGRNYTISGNHAYNVDQALEITSREPYDMHIYDVTVVGNVFNGIDRGIWLYGNVSRVIIDGNVISGASGIMASPVNVNTSQDHVVISNNIIKKTSYGLYFTLQTAPTNNFLIVGNMIQDASQQGIMFNSPCHNISVVANYFVTNTYGTTANGIRQASAVTDLVIQGNTFTNLQFAIYGLKEGQVLSGNTFIDAGGGGYTVLVSGKDCGIFGNTFIGGGATCQVYINGYTNTTIVGNLFTEAVYGVKAFTTSDYTYIVGNSFKDCTSSPGYSLTGTHNVVANNTGI